MTTVTEPAVHVDHRSLQRQRWTTRLRNWRAAWRIYRQNRIAVLGLLIIIAFALIPLVYFILRNTAWEGRVYDPVTGFDNDNAPHPAPPSWLPVDAKLIAADIR